MADYGLAAALGERRARRMGENSALRSGLAIQQFDTSGYDLNPWENLLVNALKGFTGGALQGYGQGQIDSQYKTDATELVTALKGEDPAMAIASNPNLAEFGPAFAVEQATDDATLRRQIKAEEAKQRSDLRLGKGMIVDPNTGAVTIDRNFTDALAETTKQQEQAKAEGQAAATANTFTNDPKTKFELEKSLRTEFSQKPEYQRFAEIYPVYESLAKSVDDESGANSLNFVYGVAKILDPGSVVREGETLNVVRSGGLPGIMQSYVQWVNGGNQLNADQRRELLAMAGGRYDEAKTVFDAERVKYEDYAKSNGLSPENVVFFPESQGAKDRLTKKESVDLKAMSRALQTTESNNDPTAVSPKGAEGIMQLMPENSRKFGVKDPFDPQQNIAGGEKLLAEEIGRFGDPALVVAAYNAGSPRVLEAMRKSKAAGRGTSFEEIAQYLPAETVNHVRKTMPLYEKFRQGQPQPSGGLSFNVAPAQAPAAGPAGAPTPPPEGETRIIQGQQYRKVKGGWQKVK